MSTVLSRAKVGLLLDQYCPLIEGLLLNLLSRQLRSTLALDLLQGMTSTVTASKAARLLDSEVLALKVKSKCLQDG